MLDFVKGITDGAWTLLVGWVFPAALNVLLFALLVLPSVDHIPPFTVVSGGNSNVVTLLVSAIAVGLVLGALQTPLYRALEGYNLWWRWRPLFAAGRRRQVRTARELRLVHLLASAAAVGSGERIEAARRRAAEVLWRERHPSGGAGPSDVDIETIQRHDRRYRRIVSRAARTGTLGRGLLDERLQRYPTSYDQFLPTRFGNAIRRLERFGPERFQLDQQVLWYELTAAAPAEAGKAVDQARSSVDFFLSLLCGNALVATAALVAAAFYPQDRPRLLVGAVAGYTLAVVWYNAAIASTDNWAAAVRALISVGRKPLADSMGLVLPGSLDAERRMWKLVGDLVTAPYDDDVSAIDAFRPPGKPTSEPPAPAAGAPAPASGATGDGRPATGDG